MKKYLAGLTLASVIAYIIIKVADDQLGVTQRINRALTGTGA